ncbi:MAG TPA: hypothetical protein VHE78_01130 [Gemmatimonadaceae bacterium]|nr:hypothetical protein [Gemmatimonadaceae bacterium]
MSRRALTFIVPVCVVLAAAGWRVTPGEIRADGRPRQHEAGPPPRAVRALPGDTVAISVINTMPHRMRLSYENGDHQVPLGDVEGNTTTQVVLRNLQGDSVTVWGWAPQHDDPFRKTFAVHARAQAVWQF